ncbi:5-carboxymethyl-2-hydroxymuconate Delta-isomerase [Pasteurella multocida]|uniref:5-carboxymethyl-2-hydroxymuconate Delta-isomerase n=1 Tax=Pasteurella multocida TaxID=747 RepID=UPI002020095C|nr:5-carboxymethyl-2-hydroxymuconate Delta-isomerase [Pasteurella multocida]MCL7799038.1 5-carboxymethyl-2-hydroxymuconate Delta-isomerase [Pasteurella multocida]MCL7806584.1 5-carboxymethyl-2-hydroxymuconate Delta-isomerase [Pasteurella multocida]MCL7806979.1 5-carboxymethyl-2-hydroxymuconate Delta-isomerase [Pasteurella multocida]MCL7810412.1 5-carboxymethyl-2-hydroxymuconate Delta-isomerase [Pasteurella multocida]MCL7813523.1 5-carboxymethyl-2-hydroxymuconate Delta-isomerase [Pasteurella mu
MPHFIVEATENLRDDVDWQPLFKQVHDYLASTGIFPLGGIRSRVHWVDVYRMADGIEDDAFVHITLKIGAGRDEVSLKPVGEQVFTLLTNYFQPLFEKRYFALSFGMAELHPTLNFKKNNVHLRFKK